MLYEVITIRICSSEQNGFATKGRGGASNRCVIVATVPTAIDLRISMGMAVWMRCVITSYSIHYTKLYERSLRSLSDTKGNISSGT